MKHLVRLSVPAAAILAVLPAAVSWSRADIYRCLDQEGEESFSNTECEEFRTCVEECVRDSSEKKRVVCGTLSTTAVNRDQPPRGGRRPRSPRGFSRGGVQGS